MNEYKDENTVIRANPDTEFGKLLPENRSTSFYVKQMEDVTKKESKEKY